MCDLTGSYPFSNDTSGIWPKYINIPRATIFLSIFCMVSTPWNIVKNAQGILAFLSGYSCLMGPMAGVMITDYYIIKKKKLDIHAMYHDGPAGIYWYTKGVNFRAWAAFCVGVGPSMPGFAKSIEPGLEIGGAWRPFTFAWLYGIAASSAAYYAVNWAWPQTNSLVEEAVLPPQRGEVEVIDGLSSEDAEGVLAGEKKESV